MTHCTPVKILQQLQFGNVVWLPCNFNNVLMSFSTFSLILCDILHQTSQCVIIYCYLKMQFLSEK